MAEDKKADDVEKFLSEQKVLEDRKQGLIDDLLKQRDAAMAGFDEKLAKLGYHANSGKAKRSHHRKSAPSPAEAPLKQTPKT